MPAQSKAQQRFMGMVHATQKGDMEAPSKEVEKAADSMTNKDAKDYASTSHKGLPNKKENMKITKERLKELVKEVMTEESEYQAFFQKALDKAGKGINDMNDDEKKAFFNKIDTAWNGKGEKKNEGNAFGAAVSDAKEKGEDEFEVGGETFQVEEVNEAVDFRDGKYRFYSKDGIGYLTYNGKKIADGDYDYEGGNAYFMNHSSFKRGQTAFNTGKDVIAYFKKNNITSEASIEEATTSSAPGEWVAYLSMPRGKKLLNTFNTARGAKQFLSKNVDKLLSGSNVESVGLMTKKQWDTTESKYAIESVVNEAIKENDWKTIYNAFVKFLKANTKALEIRVMMRDEDATKKAIKSIISGLTNAQRSLKLESVNEVSYNVKADNAYQFINGAYAVLGMYLKDEKLESGVKNTLTRVVKDLEGLRKYFFSRKDESINTESVNEVGELPAATIPASIKTKLVLAIDKIKDSKLTYNQKIQVIGQVMDSLGIDKSEFGRMSSKLKGTMESVIKEAGPCWDGYKQVGMKEKGGKQVPNCVPEGKMNETSLSWKNVDKYANAISNLTQIDTKDVKKFIENNKLDIEKIFAITHKTSQGKADFVKAIKAAPSSSIQKDYVNKFTNESVNEAASPKDMDKIKSAVEAASSFMGVGSELKKLGMKYTFATEPLAIYIVQPTPNNKVAIVNKKYASKPDFVVGDIAVGIMEGIKYTKK